MHIKVHIDAQGRRGVGGSSGRTEYGRVMAALEQRIADPDDLKVGDKIPSTQGLMDQYGASSTAVRRAVKELVAKGLLEGIAGKGVFVTSKPENLGEEDEAPWSRLDQRLAAMEDRVEELDKADREQLQELRKELRAVRRSVGALHTHLIELYGRLGQPFPDELLAAGVSASDESDDVRRAAGA
ncbi:GntR family transcriptional regulator [Streptomyces sp. NPDC001668]|uniref:GntR family transcriptional regulator n=1 Tax=Streptomyces sp. NPDC001668 TaxID=3364598 RepID=UPI0036B52890